MGGDVGATGGAKRTYKGGLMAEIECPDAEKILRLKQENNRLRRELQLQMEGEDKRDALYAETNRRSGRAMAERIRELEDERKTTKVLLSVSGRQAMRVAKRLGRRIRELEAEHGAAIVAVRKVVENMWPDPDNPGRVSWSPTWPDAVEAFEDLRALVKPAKEGADA